MTHTTTKSMAQSIDLLKNYGLKRTPARMAILHILQTNEVPLSIQQIVDRLSPKANTASPDWTTVFRTVQLFEKKGLVASFTCSDGSRRFEPIRGPEHHHHIYCIKCKKVDHLKSCSSAILNRFAKATGYSRIVHNLEFQGLCPSCSDT